MSRAILLCLFMITTVIHIVNTADISKSDLPDTAIALNAAGTVTLKWAYSDTYIIMQLKAPTTGWMAIGTSPSGSMVASDIAAMWVDANGNTILKDMNAAANGPPNVDDINNLDLIDGVQDGGETTVTFGRKVAGCEDKDNKISKDTLRVIWAYGTSLPSDGQTLTVTDKHDTDKRGSKSLRLLSKISSPTPPTGADISSHEIKQSSLTLPTDTTYYHCNIQQLDLSGNKRHMIYAEPVIESGNEAHVHHMILWVCSFSSAPSVLSSGGHQCYQGSTPADYQECETMLLVWAIGGGPQEYPTGTGYALDDSSTSVYLLLETHYDNPDGLSTITDSSGMKIYVTSTAPTHEMGVLYMGQHVNADHIIPSGVSEWKTFAECTRDCFSDQITGDSVTIYGVLLHSHIIGRKLYLRHYRDNIELEPISQSKYYDFDYQEFNSMENPVTLNKGDELAMECIFDSTSKTAITVGGLATSEEMCLAFVQYYPKIDVSKCETTFIQSNVAAILQSTNTAEYYANAEAHSNKPQLNIDINKATHTISCTTGGTTTELTKTYVERTPYVEPSSDSQCGSLGLKASMTSVGVLFVFQVVFF